MAPTIPPTAKVRLSTSSIRRQGGRDLGDPQLIHSGFDHSLSRALHACCPQVKLLNRSFAESAQPAMKVSAGTVKEKPAHSRHRRMAQVPMQRRHRSRLHAALEAVAHYQV